MRAIYIIPVLVIVIAGVLSSIFIVDERERVLVLQFGEVRQVVDEPGLYLKVPFIQDVLRYDDRILGLPTNPLEVTPLDDRRLVVDAFARWRIVDLQKFRRAVGSGGEATARDNLDKIINAEIREVLGSVPSQSVLSEDRTALMNKIRDNARAKALTLGIDVIDVRLTRTDLPQQNLEATFARMRAEREREATDEVARGNEAAQRIKAEADRSALEVTSEAQKEAEIIRGQADAKRIAIYAAAYGKDPEFFAFTRSLTAYAKALPGSNTSIVLEPDSEFFRYLRADNPDEVVPSASAAAGAAPAPATPAAETTPAPATPAPTAP